MRVGNRMTELCSILEQMGGESPSQKNLYMRLNYRGLSSNKYGHAVLERCYNHGLVKGEWTPANGITYKVRLTDKGREIARRNK